jgi:predicted phage terminase large subunit-like protein
VIGVDPEDRLFLLDIWRARTSTDVWVDALCDLVLKYKPMGWSEEKGQITAGIGPFLDRRARERKAYFVRTQFPTRADKATRARSMQGMMALQGLYVPIHAKWYPDFRAELLAFPQGKHEDQVDGIGLIGQLLDTVISGKKREATTKHFDISRDAYRTLPSAQVGAYAMGGSASNLSWGDTDDWGIDSWKTM